MADQFDPSKYINVNDPHGLNPTLPPQQFLGQIMGKLTGYEPPIGDEITPSDSPIDIIPGAIAAKAAPLIGKAISRAAPAVEARVASELFNPGAGAMRLDPTSYTQMSEMAQRAQNAKKMGFDTSKTYYHGTKADIESFAPEALGSATGAPSAKQGFFFGTDAPTSGDYSEAGITRGALEYRINPKKIPEIERLQKQYDSLTAKFDKAFDEKNHASYEFYNNERTDVFKKLRKLKEDSGIFENSWELAAYKMNNSQELTDLNKLLEKKEAEFTQKLYEKLDSPDYKHETYTKLADKLEKEKNGIRDRIRTIKQDILQDSQTEGSNVIPVHLKMENPYIHDFKGSHYREESYNNILKKAKEAGHDSVILKNTYDPGGARKVMQDVAVVFDPSQIRSVNAKFDPSKAKSTNITHHEGGEVKIFQEGGEVNPMMAPVAPPITEQELESFDASGYLEGLKAQDAADAQAQYGGMGQTALGAGEAALKGIIGPGGPLLEKALTEMGVPGLSPEEQRGRAAASPLIHTGSELGALVASSLLPISPLLKGFTLGHRLESAGKTAAYMAGLEGATGIGSKLLAGGIRGATEGALYGISDETSKLINSDPAQSVESVPMDIGMSAILGAGFGAAFGAVTPAWKKSAEPVIRDEIEGFKQTMDGMIPAPPPPPGAPPIPPMAPGEIKTGLDAVKVLQEGSGKLKENVEELRRMAKEHEWGLPPGIENADKNIDRVTDMLLKGPPTIPSNWLKNQYEKAYQAVKASVTKASEAPPPVSETEAGVKIIDSMSDKLEQEIKPINELYEAIKPIRKLIRLPVGARRVVTDEIQSMIASSEIVPGTEAHKFMMFWGDKFANSKNLEQLAQLTTAMNDEVGPTVRNAAQRMRFLVNDLRENAIMAYGKKATGEVAEKIKDFNNNLLEANFNYSNFRTKLQELGDNLGHSRIYGATDFLDFIKGMNPQDLMKRVFKQGNTQFAEYFAKNFPEEMAIIKDYQRAEVLRKSLTNETLDPKKLAKNLEGMQKEMRNLLFSPQEQKVIKDAKSYLTAFPGNYNPSGSAHEIEWYKALSSPKDFAIHNLKDAGLLSVVKAASSATEGGGKNHKTILGTLASPLASMKTNVEGFKHSVEMVNSVHAGQIAAAQAAKSVFESKESHAATITPEQLKKLDKHVSEYQVNPEKYDQVGGQSGYYLPNQGIAVKAMAANVVGYLSQNKPHETKLGPLDPVIPPSEEDQARYDRILKIAQNPLHTIDLLKQGTLTPEDMQHLNAMYPAAANKISQLLVEEITNAISSGKEIPYETRQGLSTFLGQPFDSGMSQQSIQSNQAVFLQSNQKSQEMAQPKPLPGAGKITLPKMTSLKKTDEQ